MQTEKLFYHDCHLRAFQAEVLSCEPGRGGWEVVLDRTAFYPEGGGQACDLGVLGGVPVLDVRERAGRLIHLCAEPLEAGARVDGEIDWDRRFDLMQQHSGEHIVSGLILAAHGLHNVGFHMGKDTITIDFDGELDAAQLREIQRQANEAVFQNLPVRTLCPDAGALASLSYRSKKALDGQVRLVEIPGTDLCACCGVHVARTGEIGPILLLSSVKFRGGVRVEMFCGRRAMAYTERVLDGNRRISGLLSAKPLETAAAVERLHGELERTGYRLTGLEDRLFAQMAAAEAGRGDVLLFEEGLSPDGVRRLAVAVGEVCGGRAAVFSGGGTDYKYALCREGGGLREFSRTMNARLNGRGGGKPHFVQGSVRAGEAEIRQFFSEAAT